MSVKPVSYQLSDREREREEWYAVYEMQVEQYQERVQKYVERTIEREKLEPRPDTTAALIRKHLIIDKEYSRKQINR
jgi:ABC-type transporter MlaC component